MECSMFQNCVDAVHVANECCSVCPNGRNCRHTDGTVIKTGEQYKPDPHTTCECPPPMWGIGGTKVHCVAEPLTPRAQTLCEKNGVHYHVGESFNLSPCEYCRCGMDGNATCAILRCLVPNCVDAVHDTTKCCPDCPNGPNCKHTDGTIIKQGEQYKPDSNTTCECPQNVYGMRGTMALCVAQPVTPLNQVQLTTRTPLTPVTPLTT